MAWEQARRRSRWSQGHWPTDSGIDPDTTRRNRRGTSGTRRYGGAMTDIASLTREEAAERAALINVERYDVHVDLRGLLRGRALGGHLDRHLHLPRARGRAPSSTASATSRRRPSTARRSTRRPPSAAGSRCPTCAPTTCWWSRTTQPDTGSGTAILQAPSTPRQAGLRLVDASSPTRPATRSPASTSPTSRRRTASWSTPTRRWTVTSNSAPDRVEDLDGDGTVAAAGWTFGDTPAALDVRHGGQRRPVPRAALAARRLRPRPVLPAVAPAVPRARRRGAVRPHRPRAGVLRRALRPAVRRRSATTRSSCPTWAARWRTGARSPGPTACSTAAPRPTASARCGPRSCCTRWRTCGSATW